ncbi:response regulator transcription factor [Anaerocolumna sp. AGMB13025]|uniref:response regulator transcription factor n=1 Tax=Anaerocolumna sp. AGMB13025 TaxID=3039116 RepID=UPI00241D7F35|nr:response regulator transcription factor [Anaerocolumna sp. AGMB13025]WFR58402.1 response regulator transcription factor [Anaerocolumna sp. AGMB13025]
MKILLVEDEEMLSAIIARGLRKAGYAVDTVYDGEEALEYYEINGYDIIILDLNIPKLDGLDVLRAIRKNDTNTKILILSARTKVDERILGLDEGANDYLIKPFDFGELEARIRNLLRRNFSELPASIIFGIFTIDTNAKKVICDGETLNLTRKEYCILEYLVLNKNKVISAEEFVEHIWDSDFDPFSNTIRYHIHSLKKKLSDYGRQEIIKTIRGQGYMIEEDCL